MGNCVVDALGKFIDRQSQHRMFPLRGVEEGTQTLRNTGKNTVLKRESLRIVVPPTL
jgi:hypothetical protein